MEPIDCLLVTHNHVDVLEAIVESIYRYADHPVRLILVDNESDTPTRRYLASLASSRADVQTVLLGENRFCCHATNLGLSLCTSKWIFYLCSNEAFPVAAGWDSACIRYMEANPRVGLAGNRVVVPRYRDASLYMQMEFFRHFRNPRYALEQPTRVMAHVQGGFWIMRRDMLQDIGYFNEALYHSYMDVEYSYYAESCGWGLGHIPEVSIRYFWKYAEEEFQPAVRLYHPLTLERARSFQARQMTEALCA